MHWNDAVDRVAPYIVKIETPDGHGTGFMCLQNHDRSVIGIATAHHVIDHAHKWQEPIRLTSYPKGASVLIPPTKSRSIWVNAQTDSALMLLNRAQLPEFGLPDEVIPMFPKDKRIAIGSEVAWMGFPGLGEAANMACFFSGNVSAWSSRQQAYLIDGVAVNGCSGGPVIFLSGA